MPGSERTDFVHLHLHSEYSLLDGAIRFDPLAELLAENGMGAVALTDHGCMFGAVEFYDLMRARGIKPIVGTEAYISPGGVEVGPETHRKPYFHITLLARNGQGYRNLVKLSSLGYLEGFYYKPRIDRRMLEEHSEGLLVGSACLQGEVAQHLLAGDDRAARKTVRYYQDLVGRENYFLELMDHGLEDEKKILKDLVELGESTEAVLAATNDAHYLRKEEARAHEVLLCIQTGKTLDDPGRMRFGSDEFYVKSPMEMKRLFSWVPRSITNTVMLAEKCELELEEDRVLLPEFEIPSAERSPDEYLRDLCYQGLRERLGRDLDPTETERLDHELAIVSEMGFPGYFLIVSEIRKWAFSQNIPVGPGRGSAAGSLISYAARITDINPLDYGLSFERFLNPARKQMPDIDLDVCYEKRGQIIEHIIEKYGRESVCQMITFNRMKARLVVRDVARTLGMSFDEGDRLAKLVATAPDPDQPVEDIAGDVPELAELAKTDDRVGKLIEYSGTLENIARNSSVHAAGVIIAPGDLTDYVPLYRTKEGEITTQYEKKAAERIGLPKLDVLGLRTITVIRHARDMARRKAPGLKLYDMSYDDPATFRLIGSGETTGVFQLESSGMREALRKMDVDKFDDITAAVAIYRPGSMHMIDMYAKNKAGVESGDPSFSIDYLHPKLESVLSATYGVIIYQEQVMEIANRLAGMSMAEADILRRAMSSKDPDVMSGMRRRFLEGAEQRGVDRPAAVRVFDQIERFAGYGFNKSHAVSYAVLAYQTAYLKVHYPAEFMAAYMASEIGNIDKLASLVRECRRLGIEIVPPSINTSYVNFDVDEEDRIVYALAAVKNVGEGPAGAIVSERDQNGPFRDIYDLCARVEQGSINRRSLESLIGAGALDSAPGNRASQLASMDRALDYGSKYQKLLRAGQMSLFGGDGADSESPESPAMESCPDFSLEEKLNLEKSLLGFYLTGHPLDLYLEELQSLATHEVEDLRSTKARFAAVGGLVKGRRLVPTRKGEMAFLTLQGRKGSSDVLVFNEELQRYKDCLQPMAALMVEGEISERNGDRKLKLTRAFPLEKARKVLNAGVMILVDGGRVDYARMERAVKLLEEHPGRGRVLVRVEHPSGWKVTGVSRSYRVNADRELTSELRKLLGDDAVRLTRGNGVAS